jgi:hypothetical protein
VDSAVVELCMGRTGPTGVVDVPMKLFPDRAAVSSDIDGIDVDFVVWPGNRQLFPLVYAVLRSEAELVVEPEIGAKDETSALDEACLLCSNCGVAGCFSLSISFLKARVLPTVLVE